MWTTGGWNKEYDSPSQFAEEASKDVSLRRVWNDSRACWVEAHNSGCVRMRPRKKTAGIRGETPADRLQALRSNRQIVAKKQRVLKTSTPMRIYSKDAYETEFKKTPEEDGYQCKWLTVQGKQPRA